MTTAQTNITQLQSFLSSFNAWQENKKQKPLLELQTFCKTFNQLIPSQIAESEVEQTPIFPANQYQSFYDNFAPLYAENIQRGAAINVWQQAGLKQDEVRNTAVLAWWLDCNGSHALGNELLACLLDKLDDSKNLPSLDHDTKYRVVAESLPLGDIEDRIDIEIQGDDFLIFIEVKINAVEGPEQLKRYDKLLHEKANLLGIQKRTLIYLTRFDQPKVEIEGCLCISWRQLAWVFQEARLPQQAQLSQQLLQQFCQHTQSF